MTTTRAAAPTRFRGPAATSRSRHLAGLTTVVVLGATAVAGLWIAPIALLAAGAGAGYSLSGSV